MRHLNYRRTLDTTLYLSGGMQSKLSGFVDRKPVLISQAEYTVDRKCNGASTNSWLQSWSSRRRRNLVSLHCPATIPWSFRLTAGMRSGIATRSMWSTWDQKSNGTGMQKKEKWPSMLNHRKSGKSLVKAIASSSPLLAYDLLKCIEIQFVCLRSATKTPWNRIVNQGKRYETLK